MRNLDVLMAAIKKKKGNVPDFKIVMEKDDESASEEKDEGEIKIDEQKEDGLAPDVTKKEGAEEDQESKGSVEEEAFEVLGRKPMSLTRTSHGEEDGEKYTPDMDDMNPDVMDQMADERAIDQLSSGKRKAKGLRDKVQMNIMKMREKK